jgi:hypothetical protein
MPCRSVACGYGEPNAISNAIDYAKHHSRSHDPVIRVDDEDCDRVGKMIFSSP